MPRRDVSEWVVDTALAIDGSRAWDDRRAGFMGRVLVQTTLPHSVRSVRGRTYYERTNGRLTLSVTGTPHYGLPSGSYPRLVLAWLTTEAVKTKSRELVLGESLSDWMRQLGLLPTGGRWGTITRLRQQMAALFTCMIRIDYRDGKHDRGLDAGTGMLVASRYQLWWDPQKAEQAGLWESRVVLSEQFFEEVTARPVPLHIDALRALRSSSMQLDLYCWLTYRMSYLKEPTVVSWEALALQFGGEYTRLRTFKEELLRHLPPVLAVYREALVAPQKDGLLLRPSPTHVPHRPSRRATASSRLRPALPAPRDAQKPAEPSATTSEGEPLGARSMCWPAWCEQCSEQTRRREDPDTGADLGRCPACHPEPRPSA